MKGFAVGFALLAGIQFAQAVEVSNIERLIEKGQHQKALTEIGVALENDQNNVALKTLQADTLAASGKTVQAINQYQKLIKQYPEKAELYNNLAILLSNQGKYEAARDTLDKGLKTSKTYAVIYDNLSNIYMEMARDSYGKALQLGVKLQPLALTKLAVTSPSIKAKPVIAMNTPMVKAVKVVKPAEVKPQTLESELTQSEISTSVTAAAAEVSASNQDVIDSLQDWAAAWSAQAPDLYLSFYHRQYSVPNGSNRASWEAQRKQRLRKPKWIQIELDDMKVEMQDKDKARVTLVQAYRSNGYQDKTRKQIVLANTSAGWRIMREHSLGLVK